MNSLHGRDTWPLLKINDDLLDRLRAMGQQGASPSEMISFLSSEGVTKPGAILALRLTKVMDPKDAKRTVHFSEDFACRRESDEAFEESVVQTMEEIDRSEAAA